MKRISDILISLILLIFLSPLFLLISLLILIKIGRPIFFIQERPGKDGEIFKMIKFRTMKIQKGNNSASSDSDRLTSFGSLLRRASLDELPELWNVFIGNMSLVGPRPLLVSYLDLYNAKQMKRHDVKPGITGWAQINGRNSISWEEKFELDLWYVKNNNFFLDLKILFITLKRVFFKENISAKNHSTMPEFKGSKND